MSEIQDVLGTVRARIGRYRSKAINEQDTKASLIQPILRVLGWDVEDLDEVQREYKQRKQDKPVDFALLLLRTPCLFVEAKALGQNLDDRRWANQIMGYAGVAGVEWVVLTDGNEYRLYNSHAPVPIDEKLFRTVRVTDSDTRPAETLALLSKDRIQENEIELLWQAYFVDRQVRSAVEQLFATDPDPDTALVRLVKKRVHNLSSKDIKASLRRAQIQFDFPIEPSAGETVATPKRRKRRLPQETKPDVQKKKKHVGVSLKDVIDAGLLKPPLKLTKHYKGHQLEAKLLPDGAVMFQGNRYKSISTSAEHARGTVTGRPMASNGWLFWQFHDSDGSLVYLDSVRQEFISRKP